MFLFKGSTKKWQKDISVCLSPCSREWILAIFLSSTSVNPNYIMCFPLPHSVSDDISTTRISWHWRGRPLWLKPTLKLRISSHTLTQHIFTDTLFLSTLDVCALGSRPYTRKPALWVAQCHYEPRTRMKCRSWSGDGWVWVCFEDAIRNETISSC